MPEEKRFAVLIDADNVSGKYVKYILDEISNEGVATYKRIYGDWTKPTLASWKTYCWTIPSRPSSSMAIRPARVRRTRP